MNTERLTLRRPQSEDEMNLYTLDTDPEVMRWINGGVKLPLALFREKILPVYLSHSNEARFGFWIIETGGEFLGWVSLRKTKNRDEASLGYRLSSSAWGKGYATEAASAVIAMGFESKAVRSIVATTYEKNIPSQRVLGKLGMVLRHRFRLSAADLAEGDTSVCTGNVWDGDDLEYAINRDQKRPKFFQVRTAAASSQ